MYKYNNKKINEAKIKYQTNSSSQSYSAIFVKYKYLSFLFE